MVHWDNYPKVELKLKQLYEKHHNDYNKIVEKMNEEFCGEVKFSKKMNSLITLLEIE